jgi:hypothetical protein
VPFLSLSFTFGVLVGILCPLPPFPILVFLENFRRLREALSVYVVVEGLVDAPHLEEKHFIHDCQQFV